MASMRIQTSSTSSSSSSPSSSPEWQYDVFLSFRGQDTRKSFTDHLYASLNQKGIIVFRDDPSLKRGKEIEPEIMKAIEESRFSIVIFSRNYASSSWCLDELVQIHECMNTKGQIIFPVFYNVDPSDVQEQTGYFEKAFAKHEEDYGQNAEKVNKWRTAVTKISNLSGWDSNNRYYYCSAYCLVEFFIHGISFSLCAIKHNQEFYNLFIARNVYFPGMKLN